MRAGLEPAEVASAVGLSKSWYHEVEFHDDEAAGNISLGTLEAIARRLGTTAVELLEGPGAAIAAGKRSLPVLVDLARTRMASEGLTMESYSNRIGWDMAPVLANPDCVLEYPFVMLRALCEDLGVDWKEFIDRPLSPG